MLLVDLSWMVTCRGKVIVQQTFIDFENKSLLAMLYGLDFGEQVVTFEWLNVFLKVLNYV